MNEPVRHHRYTSREHVALERFANVKHELLDGEILAMAGGTPEHAALGMAVGSAPVVALRGRRCGVCSADLSIRALETGLATHRDGSVVCGELVRDPEDGDAATHPKMVVEVTSESTESYDRGTKSAHDQRIPSLDAILLVSHGERRLDLWSRGPDGELACLTFGAGDHARVAAAGVTLSVDEICGALVVEPALGETGR